MAEWGGGFESLIPPTYLPTYFLFCYQSNLKMKFIVINRRFGIMNFVTKLFRWQKKRKLEIMLLYLKPRDLENKKTARFHCKVGVMRTLGSVKILDDRLLS